MDSNANMDFLQRLNVDTSHAYVAIASSSTCARCTAQPSSRECGQHQQQQHQQLQHRLHSQQEGQQHHQQQQQPPSATTTAGGDSTRRRLCTLLLLCTLFSSAYGCGPGRGIGGPRGHRKVTPLVYKQHVPNMAETALGASGSHEGAIKLGSPKFKDLVPNYNKDIIFKDDEGNGADRLMSRRCKEKLNTLAVSVMNQWPGVRLRVTESWDEEIVHGVDSLHNEGRAVDITTSDRDRTKYGMLARLAVEAGFDWVYYESRAHIHCSVKSDSSHISHVSGCFTGDSTVLTASGERRAMRDLAIGDRVLSMAADGEPVYSEVIMFMDRDLQLEQEFVQLSTDGGATLTVTPAHLVLVWHPGRALTHFMFADHVEEGDQVLVDDAHGHLRPQRVVAVRAVRRRGVVAPLTMEGTIVVDSVAASCYAIVNSQSLAHWGLAPIRLMATVRSWLPSAAAAKACGKPLARSASGLATAKGCTSRSSSSSSDVTAAKQNGVHWYAKALYTLKDYVVPHEWRYQ